jgi:hypothetical protein
VVRKHRRRSFAPFAVERRSGAIDFHLPLTGEETEGDAEVHRRLLEEEARAIRRGEGKKLRVVREEDLEWLGPRGGLPCGCCWVRDHYPEVWREPAPEECAHCGWSHSEEAPCVDEDGEEVEDPLEELRRGCRAGERAHGIKLMTFEETRRYLWEELRPRGKDALLPCGACRAGEVFPQIFEHDVRY